MISLKYPDGKLQLLIFSTSVVVAPWFLIDATVLPKFAALMILSALLSFRMIAGKRISDGLHFSNVFIILNLSLICLIIISLLFSNHLWLSIFGEYSRSFGAATILGLIVISLYFSIFNSKKIEIALIKLFQITANLVSGYYVIQFFDMDVISWEGWYGVPSSFLGNPNFVSSYAAIGLAVSAAMLLLGENNESRILTHKKFRAERISKIAAITLHLFVVVTNGSKQGYVLIVLAGFLLLVMKMPRLSNSRRIRYVFSITSTSCLILGFYFFRNQLLQLSEVQSRWFYLDIAVRMSIDNLPFGVGFGEYPYYFREYRDVNQALEFGYGPNIYSDSSHNLFADLLLGAGPLAAVVYISIFTIVIKQFFNSFREQDSARKIFFLILICFMSQAIISPPQLSLMLWGHISLGILAYRIKPPSKQLVGNSRVREYQERLKRTQSSRVTNSKISKQTLFLIPGIFVFAATAPLRTDFSFLQSFYTQNLEIIEGKALSFPTNSARLRYAASIMCANGEPKRAARILDFAIKQNSRDYENIYYYLKQDLNPQKRLELSKRLQNLDPKSPDSAVGELLKLARDPDCREKGN